MSNYSTKANHDEQKKYNKFLMLEIRDILWKETVKEHPLTVDEVCGILEDDMGIQCNPRTVAENINELRQYDMNLKIEQTMKGKKKAYYCGNPLFELGEIVYMIQEIRGSKSLSIVESERMIQKIRRCSSEYYWNNVIEKLPVKFAKKHNNHDVTHYVGIVSRAISQKKQVSFLYFDVDSYGKRNYHHNSKVYKVSPLHLVIDNDHCYMIGFDPEEGGVRNYRFDRMDQVKKLDLDWHQQAEKAIPDVLESLDEMVEMYGGEKIQMVIDFDQEIIKLLRSQFGDEITVGAAKEGNGKLQTTLRVREGPPLFGKIFVMGANAKIVWPQQLKNEYLKKINEIVAQYHLRLVDETGQVKNY